MKQGFMLIELIIASLVASMVAAILLAALAQSNRFQTIVDNLVDTSMRVGVVSYQLEKDLMGAFIPEQAKEPSTAKSEQSEKNSAAQAASEKKGAEGTTEKKEEKVIEKIFYSTNKDGQFNTLTFITNNPLVAYVGKDVGVVKPKVVRVQYTLKPEEEKKNSYALFRQESMELDLDLYKNVTSYEVIGGIKSCTMTFTARIEKKQDSSPANASEKSKSEKPKVEYEYKVLNEWVSEQKKEAEKEQQEFPRIPYSIEIKMILWDLQDKKEKEFTLICQIPTDFAEPKEDAQPEQKPKEEDKNEATQDKGKEQKSETAHNYMSSQETITIVADGSGKILQAKDVTKIFGRK